MLSDPGVIPSEQQRQLNVELFDIMTILWVEGAICFGLDSSVMVG